MTTIRPPKTDAATERKALCDLTLQRATELMIEGGAPLEMVIDRLVTYGVGRMVAAGGKDLAASTLRSIAEKVDGGAFDHVDPSKRRH